MSKKAPSGTSDFDVEQPVGRFRDHLGDAGVGLEIDPRHRQLDDVLFGSAGVPSFCKCR